MTYLRSRLVACAATLFAALVLASASALAQSDASPDSTTPRLRRYEHNLLYGVALGFVWAGVDQLQDDPTEWGKGWPGYGKRLASDVGEFVIQETVTDIGAAILHRPLSYQHCTCTSTANRVGWALKLGVMDRTRSGHLRPAYPRIVGAYAGSFAQASWRPAESTSRTETALINGTVSLAIGAGINVYYEFMKKKRPIYAAAP